MQRDNVSACCAFGRCRFSKSHFAAVDTGDQPSVFTAFRCEDQPTLEGRSDDDAGQAVAGSEEGSKNLIWIVIHGASLSLWLPQPPLWRLLAPDLGLLPVGSTPVEALIRRTPRRDIDKRRRGWRVKWHGQISECSRHRCGCYQSAERVRSFIVPKQQGSCSAALIYVQWL